MRPEWRSNRTIDLTFQETLRQTRDFAIHRRQQSSRNVLEREHSFWRGLVGVFLCRVERMSEMAHG